MSARNRNKLCPCGSGLKEKRCHGSAAVHNAAKEAIEEAQRKRWEEEDAEPRRDLRSFPLGALIMATGMITAASYVKKNDFR